MRRGTTPVITLSIDGAALSELTSIYVTLKQGSKQITKETDDITIVDDTTLEIPLSQADTLAFSAKPVAIQLRALIGNTAIASDIQTVNVEEILQEGVIT